MLAHAGLFAVILTFGPVSGGPFNPAVSLLAAAFGGLRHREAAAYVPVQVAGCVAGAIVANAMSALAAISVGRMFSASFAGIAPASVLPFIAAQLAGALVAFVAIRALYPDIGPATAADVVVLHPTPEPT